MIINIEPGTFGGPLRNGDMIALLNVVQHLRKESPDIKFHMLHNTINSATYCQEMFQFLRKETNYFSDDPGTQSLSWKKVNLWDFRDISGDVGVIPNNREMKKKIVIFPLTDAPYNTYRNWSPEVFLKVIFDIDNNSVYNDYQKVICHIKPMKISGWEDSGDFMTNLEHIMESEVFVGAETGSAVFASALDRPPKQLIYYYSSRGLVHTLPFNVLRGKGKLRTYWDNFEGTTWN